MRDEIGLIVCLIVYTLVMFLFGGWIEWRIVNYQLPKIIDKAWVDGCRKCAQFEKDAAAHDQLQGVEISAPSTAPTNQ